MASESSPIPLYHQVFGVLRQRILDGSYPAGMKLAPEDELASEFNVSRATVRQAVGQLVQSGMLSRQQGRGTFVLPGAVGGASQIFSGSLPDLMRETGRTKIRAVELEHEAELPCRVATQLELPSPLGTIIRRTRERDGVAFAYTINFLPPETGKMITRRDLRQGSLMRHLEANGITFATAQQTIRAQLADVTVSESLGVQLSSAVLFVERLLRDEQGAPVEFVQSFYRGDLYEYMVKFDRSEGDLSRRFA